MTLKAIVHHTESIQAMHRNVARSEILPNLLSCILLQERIFLSGSEYVQPGLKPLTWGAWDHILEKSHNKTRWAFNSIIWREIFLIFWKPLLQIAHTVKQATRSCHYKGVNFIKKTWWLNTVTPYLGDRTEWRHIIAIYGHRPHYLYWKWNIRRRWKEKGYITCCKRISTHFECWRDYFENKCMKCWYRLLISVWWLPQ